MEGASRIAVGFAAIWCTGCTLIQVSHYWSPAAPGATYARDPLGSDVASIYSGPPNSLELDADGLRLGFSCWNTGYTPLLIGPVLLPIAPIVLLAPILREPLQADRLRIAVYIEPRGERLRFTPGRIRVIDPQDGVLEVKEIRADPGNPPRVNQNPDTARMAQVSPDDEVSLDGPTLFVFEVEAASQFRRAGLRVSIEGLSKRGSPVALPAIELTAASGLELQMGP